MAVSHVFSNTVANWTGTVTVGNSDGNTLTIAATDLVRPTDWNSAHNQFYTLTGNTTANTTASATNVVFAGSGGVSVGASTDTVIISGPMLSNYGNLLNGVGVGANLGNSTAMIQPIWLVQPLAFSVARIWISVANANSAANNSSAYLDVSMSLVLYSRNVSTLSYMTSGSATATASWSSNATGTMNGRIFFDVTFNNTTLTVGEYWMAQHVSTTNSATGGANTTALTCSVQYIQQGMLGVAHRLGVATSNSVFAALGAGILSTNNTRSSIAFSDYSANASCLFAYNLMATTIQSG